MSDYEKLGAFYLGKAYDLEAGATKEDLVLYDSKDLTTHAVCVGMTGSGKTGLCLSLLEEAAMDNIPVIAIDPKGDIGNLMLSFPELLPDDFQPWVDVSSATRKGMTVEQYSKHIAKVWRDGLASWGQQPERIKQLRDTTDINIFTPGSSAGIPLTVLRSFSPPSIEVLQDADAFRERVSGATAGLLALLDVDADPVQSREFILISNLLDQAWRAGETIAIPDLILQIQEPPFDKVGILDLDTFFPKKDRTNLAMKLNNLLASPSFSQWMKGDPLDVAALMHSPEGKARISIVSIAHLSDSERMFFVTILLNEVLAWMRSQPGTSSLRAILYMDEVFGYFPPVANPPSKQPMLTLLKQARAFGLGIVLATQNPVDLDYKGLSNAGTWFLGRLQTERDKKRVLEGLEGASAQSGGKFDRGEMEQLLASLGSRVFLMNNVHDDGPIVFQTRWAMSYLRGPLSRGQIKKLMKDRKPVLKTAGSKDATSAKSKSEDAVELDSPPQLAPGELSGVPTLTFDDLSGSSKSKRKSKKTAQKSPSKLDLGDLQTTESTTKISAKIPVSYWKWSEAIPGPGAIVYRPALIGVAKAHYIRSTHGIDDWKKYILIAPIGLNLGSVWDNARIIEESELRLTDAPNSQIGFADLDPKFADAKNYSKYGKQLKDNIYQTQTVTVWKSSSPKGTSRFSENERDFRARVMQQVREQRDIQLEKLRAQYTKKLDSLKRKIDTAAERTDREQAQYKRSRRDSTVSLGSSILGALFGRKLKSQSNVTRAASSARSFGKTSDQKDDVDRAQEKVDALQEELQALEAEFQQSIEAKKMRIDVADLDITALEIRPRKSDTQLESIGLLWIPQAASQP